MAKWISSALVCRSSVSILVELLSAGGDRQTLGDLLRGAALAFARRNVPLDRPEEALHDRRVFIAVDAHRSGLL